MKSLRQIQRDSDLRHSCKGIEAAAAAYRSHPCPWHHSALAQAVLGSLRSQGSDRPHGPSTEMLLSSFHVEHLL